MLGSIEFFHGSLHAVMGNDIVKGFLILGAIIDGKSDTIDAETSGSTNSVKVGLGIC